LIVATKRSQLLVLNAQGGAISDVPISGGKGGINPQGAIITVNDEGSDIGEVVVYGRGGFESVNFVSLTLDFKTGKLIKTNWEKSVRIPGMNVEIETAGAMNKGRFALAGKVRHGWKIRKEDETTTKEDLLYDRAIVIALDAQGNPIFEHRSSEAAYPKTQSKSHYSNDGVYSGLAYNPVSNELAAACHLEEVGLVEIFDESGKVKVVGKSEKDYETFELSFMHDKYRVYLDDQPRTIAPLTNSKGFWIGGAHGGVVISGNPSIPGRWWRHQQYYGAGQVFGR
jgi:hypothetical protein